MVTGALPAGVTTIRMTQSCTLVLMRYCHLVLSTALLALAGCASGTQQGPAEADLIRPEALVKMLQQQPPPAIFYVGPPVLYRAAHIPGARLAGPGTKPEGLEMLKAAVSDLRRDAEVVIYCGCCPWDQCPNVKPAFKLLRDMGFRRAKVLFLPTNMRTDWTAKGYPLERPQGPDSRLAH